MQTRPPQRRTPDVPPLRLLEAPVALNNRHSDTDFEADCRMKFEHYCRCYAVVSYHSEKRMYMEKAYEVIEAWLDHRDIQSL